LSERTATRDLEQRFGALIELEGDEWDAEYERLEREWLAAYTSPSSRSPYPEAGGTV